MLLVCFWLAFGEDLVGGLGPGEWVAALVLAVDEGADLGVEVLDGGEDSSAMAARSMTEKKISTMLSQEALVGVKWTWTRGLASSQARTSGILWVA